MTQTTKRNNKIYQRNNNVKRFWEMLGAKV